MPIVSDFAYHASCKEDGCDFAIHGDTERDLDEKANAFHAANPQHNDHALKLVITKEDEHAG